MVGRDPRPDAFPTPPRGPWLALGARAARALARRGADPRHVLRAPHVHAALALLADRRIEGCLTEEAPLRRRPQAALGALRRGLGRAPLWLLAEGAAGRVARLARENDLPCVDPGVPDETRRVPGTAPRDRLGQTSTTFAEDVLAHLTATGEFAHFVVQHFARATRAGCVHVWTRADEGRSYRLAASAGWPQPKLAEIAIGAGRGLAGGVTARQRPLVGRTAAGGPFPGTQGAFVVLPFVAGRTAGAPKTFALLSLSGFPGDRLPPDVEVDRWMAWGRSAAAGLAQLERTERAEALTRVDPLTGLLNRRALDEATIRVEAGAARSGDPFAVFLADLDHFHDVNRRVGMDGGDRALRLVADRLAEHFRATDHVARWGGEEFLVLLIDPGTEREVWTAAERVRRKIADTRIQVSSTAPRFHVTLSGGTALSPEDGATVEALIRRADARLRQAKRAGRNRIVGREEARELPPSDEAPPTSR